MSIRRSDHRPAAAHALVRLAAVVLLAGCSSAGGDETHQPTPAVLQTISDSALAQLAQRRIFFGHQSVGFNIVQGIEEVMAADPRVKLRLVKSATPETVDGPALVHAAVGENTRPESKDADFRKILEAGFGATGDIALYKYCYVDVTPATDVTLLFEGYKRTMAALEARYPGLTFVHVTQPLVAPESALASRLRVLLGKASDRVLNAKRNEFNRLLVAEYGATGRVFDLAAAESTRPDGSRVSYRLDGQTVYALAPEYTNDGGHLDAEGRRHVAEQFVAFLARLTPRSAERRVAN